MESRKDEIEILQTASSLDGGFCGGAKSLFLELDHAAAVLGQR